MKTLVLPFGYPGYPQKELAEKIEKSINYLKDIGVDVERAPNVITLNDCESAIEVARDGDYDYCIVLIASWIECPNVLRIISAAGLERMPILLWSHDNVYDEKIKEYISFGSVAVAAVLRESFEEFGYSFKFVVGNDYDAELTKEIKDFNRAAKCIKRLANTRIGMIGYASMGMYTGLGDHVKIKKLLGTEVVHLDQYTLVCKAEAMDRNRIEAYKPTMKAEWNISDDVTEADIEKTIAFYLALRDMVEEHKLDGVTVKCQYELSIEYGFTPCVALSILGAEMPVSCEGDVYMLLTQMVMNYISEDTTTYGDILAFQGDSIISAACGFAPKCFLNAARPCIKRHTALYSGLLVTSGIKGDKIATVGRIANCGDGFKMHVIKGKTEEINNFHEIDCPPYPGARIHLLNKTGKAFANEIMSQHYVMVFEDYVDAIELFCDLKGIRKV
ncbi:MAG: hypothetical protein IJX16_07030 [Clostridia bacterium]|nr:hypothetical protein [Clostridia bacterium]